jgi:hypothetical protein
MALEKYNGPYEHNRLRTSIGEIIGALFAALFAVVIMGFIIAVVLPFILKYWQGARL